MEITPIETAPLISKIADQSALDAFMMLVILGLCGVAIYLYKDGRTDRKETTEALGAINATLAGLKGLIDVIVHKN